MTPTKGNLLRSAWRHLFWRWLCISCDRIALNHLFCGRCRTDVDRWAKQK